MQMGLNNFSAKDVINKLDVKDLEKNFQIFWRGKKSQKK